MCSSGFAFHWRVCFGFVAVRFCLGLKYRVVFALFTESVLGWRFIIL